MDQNQQNPHHDAMFKKAFGRRETAEEYMRNFLPLALTEGLSFKDMKLDKNSYVDEKLKEYLSDIVWNLPYEKDKKMKVVFLFEHKSNPDKYVALQTLRYMVNIWSTQLEKKQKLLPVIPVIVYHGKRKWMPQKMRSLIPGIKDHHLPYIPDFEMQFRNLTELTQEELTQFNNQMTYLQVKALAASRDKERMLAMIKELMQAELNFNDFEVRNIFNSLIVYTYNSFGDDERLEKELNKLPPSKNQTVMKSIAQKLVDKGKEEGKQEGQIKFAKNLIQSTDFDDEKISSLTELSVDQVAKLRDDLSKS